MRPLPHGSKTSMHLAETAPVTHFVHHQKILDNTPALVYIYDIELARFVFCSKGIYTALGYSKTEIRAMAGTVREQLYHPADLPLIAKHERQIKLLAPEEVYSYSFRMCCADGDYRWFVTRIRGYEYDMTGKMRQYIGVCSLLAEEDNLYSRLAAEELRFRAIYNSTTDLNVFVDQHFHLLAINHTALRYIKKYYNYSLHPGDSVLQILPPRWNVAIRKCLQQALNGQNTDLVLSYNAGQENTITFRFRFFPVRSANGDVVGVNVNASNISRLSAATQKVEKQTQQLKEIAQLNAHQIRKPLTSILGLLHLIELQHNHIDVQPELKTMLDALQNSAHELDQVIRSIVSTASGEHSDWGPVI